MYNAGYPTTTFSWADNSGAASNVLFSANTDGLNVPFAFIMAERGAPGEIYFGGAKELFPIFGSASFDESSKYFTPATRFIGTAMAGQGVEVMRLVDPDATKATLGIFLEVREDVDIIQYQKDEDGVRLVDEDGDFVPVLASGDPVTEPGVKVKWVVRVLTSQEHFDTLTPVVVSGGQDPKTTYPILGIEVLTPGLYGNRQGLKLYSTGTLGAAVAEDVNSVIYRLSPMELPTSVSTTASAIPDINGSLFSDFSFKDVAVYSKTATNYALKYLLKNSYVNSATQDSSLPYNIHVYGAHIATIGQKVLDASEELGAIDPYLIDLISGRDIDGIYYDHLEVDAASSTVVSSDHVNYALGGTDGVVSFAKLQELIVDWCEGSDHGEFTNLQQHPMTHFSDPGFTMDTKYALLNMLDLRDNFKIDLSTQDVSLPVNTKAQDMSAGQALLFRAQLHPESVINGVGCTRVGIYAHAGELVNGTAYTGLVPFNLNRLMQRRDLDGATYIKGSSGGQPNSNVTIFRKANWVADDTAARANAWASAINVVSHADRTTIFYPSLRTVYPNDTSLLSDDEFSDRILYAFKICRQVWAIYAGVREKKSKLFDKIQREIKNRCDIAFGNDDIAVIPTVFQTAADSNLGYAYSVNMQMQGNMPARQANFNVIVERQPEA